MVVARAWMGLQPVFGFARALSDGLAQISFTFETVFGRWPHERNHKSKHVAQRALEMVEKSLAETMPVFLLNVLETFVGWPQIKTKV